MAHYILLNSCQSFGICSNWRFKEKVLQLWLSSCFHARKMQLLEPDANQGRDRHIIIVLLVSLTYHIHLLRSCLKAASRYVAAILCKCDQSPCAPARCIVKSTLFVTCTHLYAKHCGYIWKCNVWQLLVTQLPVFYSQLLCISTQLFKSMVSF